MQQKFKIISLTAITMTSFVSPALGLSPFVNQYMGIIGGWSNLYDRGVLQAFDTLPNKYYRNHKSSGLGGGYFGYGLSWGNLISSLEGLVFYDGAKNQQKTGPYVVTAKRGMVYEVGVRVGFLLSSDTLLYGRIGVAGSDVKFTTTAGTASSSASKFRPFAALGGGIERIVHTKSTGNIILRMEYSYQATSGKYSFLAKSPTVGTYGRRHGGHIRSHYLRVGIAKPH